jgi:hypothetical protein
MTVAEAEPSCRVSLLVPHPRRVAILVAEAATPAATPGPPDALRIPTLLVPGEEPLVSDIVALADVVDSSGPAVLRQVITSSSDSEDGADSGADNGGAGESGLSILVEFDSGSAEPPAGWRWHDLDEDSIARLEPDDTRAAVASWVRERVEGWSPRRPAWSHPGWFARASTWMVEQMAADGRPAVEAPRQHELWGLSVILRAPSAEGDVFFKCSPEAFRSEAALTQALGERMPDLVPEVIAVDRAQGWMLMRDLGADELGEQDESTWHVGVTAHAGIQQTWLGRADELIGIGVPVRSLTDLGVQVEAMTEDTGLMARMTPELRERWRATVPTLTDSCHRLDELGPGPALVHGDFHPWNVVSGARGARVFDWTDAAVSHPFVDLATYIFRTRDISVRRALVDAYVDAWSPWAPEESLREAAALGLVVGTLYQVQTYRALLPTLMRDGADDDLGGADVEWINRSLTRHQLGVESPL